MFRVATGIALAAAVSVAGCYTADSLRQRPPIGTAAFAGSPPALARCLADQYLFERDLPLEVATDNLTGQARVTRLVRTGSLLTGPAYYWEVLLKPLAGGASRAEIRSSWLPVGEYVDAEAITAMLQSCSTREAAPARRRSVAPGAARRRRVRLELLQAAGPGTSLDRSRPVEAPALRAS